MKTTLKMPKVGDAANAAVIVGISVAPGAMVRDGQTLMEVETDKATVEVPSPVAGTVTEVLISVGDEVPTGAPTFVIEVRP
jgi:pyruvate/2-oxoglutarate dehydrogenase complex dihydrolipoamide acyltransferase (E2) component